MDAVAVAVAGDLAAVDGDLAFGDGVGRGAFVDVAHVRVALDAVVGDIDVEDALVDGHGAVGRDAVVGRGFFGGIAVDVALHGDGTRLVEDERGLGATLDAVFGVGDAGEVAIAAEGHLGQGRLGTRSLAHLDAGALGVFGVGLVVGQDVGARKVDRDVRLSLDGKGRRRARS